MLFGSFSEAGKDEIELPEDNEDDVRAFVNWTYTGNVGTCHKDLYVRDVFTPEPVDIVVKFWILADKFLAPELSNDAMKCIMGWYNYEWLSAETAEFVYAHTPRESPLRLFIRDFIISEGPFNGERIIQLMSG